MEEYQAQHNSVGLELESKLKNQAVTKILENNLRQELKKTRVTMKESVEHVKQILLDFLCQVSIKLYESDRNLLEGLDIRLPTPNDILNLEKDLFTKFDNDVDNIMSTIWFVWHNANKNHENENNSIVV